MLITGAKIYIFIILACTNDGCVATPKSIEDTYVKCIRHTHEIRKDLEILQGNGKQIRAYGWCKAYDLNEGEAFLKGEIM